MLWPLGAYPSLLTLFFFSCNYEYDLLSILFFFLLHLETAQTYSEAEAAWPLCRSLALHSEFLCICPSSMKIILFNLPFGFICFLWNFIQVFTSFCSNLSSWSLLLCYASLPFSSFIWEFSFFCHIQASCFQPCFLCTGC